MDLTPAVREHWEQTQNRDPRAAAIAILATIPGDQFTDTFVELIAAQYTAWLAKNARETRRNPAMKPARVRDNLMIDINYRPFAVNGAQVFYRDMTAQHLRDWSRNLRKDDPNITWARENIKLLRQHKVIACGDLPDTVKRSLFAG